MKQTVSTLMSREVHQVGMDATLAEVERQLAESGLNWLPVFDPDNAVVGVISATDLLHWHAKGCDPQVTRAWQLCTYKPVTVAPETPLQDVAREMSERGIHHVVVMDGQRLAGVLSSLDLVRYLAAD